MWSECKLSSAALVFVIFQTNGGYMISQGIIGFRLGGSSIARFTVAGFMLAIATGVFCGSVHAATIASYTASDDPADNPDANGNTVNVWTVSATDGGSYFGNYGGGMGGDSWQIYNFAVDPAGTATVADHTFLGGALTPGQSVSLRMDNQGVANGGAVGVEIRDNSNMLVQFGLNGGDNYYHITDSNGFHDPSGGTRQDNNDFTVTFSITSPTTYTITTSGLADDINFSSSTVTLTAATIIRVFGFQSGNASDVGFNDLTIVPEPSSLLLVGLGAIGLAAIRRRRMR